MRRIVIHEDHLSIPFPERQMHAYVPYLLENPKLRVHRRVDLWNSVYPWTPLSIGEWPPSPISVLDGFVEIRGWLREAASLAAYFISQGEIPRLILEFTGEPQHTWQIFDAVQRATSMQEALVEWGRSLDRRAEESIDSDTGACLRDEPYGIPRDVVTAIRDTVEGSPSQVVDFNCRGST
jgi:hypothetical protein